MIRWFSRRGFLELAFHGNPFAEALEGKNVCLDGLGEKQKTSQATDGWWDGCLSRLKELLGPEVTKLVV